MISTLAVSILMMFLIQETLERNNDVFLTKKFRGNNGIAKKGQFVRSIV